MLANEIGQPGRSDERAREFANADNPDEIINSPEKITTQLCETLAAHAHVLQTKPYITVRIWRNDEHA
jgi:hypothetical protein